MDVVLHNNAASPNGRPVSLNEVYLDGKLKSADLIDEDEKSFGIFMHSLILSNYAEVMMVDNKPVDVIGNDYEKAIYRYTVAKGFDKQFIESIAPKVTDLSFGSENNVRVSTHIINDKLRIVSKGTPDELMKKCSYILLDSKFVKITRRIYRGVNDVLKDMLDRCVNVYAIALKDISEISKAMKLEAYVEDMTLVALIGMGRA